MVMISEAMDNIVSQLTALNEREFVEILNRVFDVFAKKFDGEGMNPDFGDRYALVRTSFIKGESDEPYVEILCRPSKAYLLTPHDEAIETGRCPTCGVLVACTDKLATCSVCGTERIECT
ncbi:MAG TPA: hypothetical protein VIF60_14755 [Burkholderiaceae bacterium]|jgi:hypothetical protein